MDFRVNRSIELMHAIVQTGYTLSLQELATIVNLSPSRFRHLFKAETGTSPAHYLRLIRMQHAKNLIETTFLTVKEIMSGVGVNDESHFTRDFKRFYGRSPSRYREQVWHRGGRA